MNKKLAILCGLTSASMLIGLACLLGGFTPYTPNGGGPYTTNGSLPIQPQGYTTMGSGSFALSGTGSPMNLTQSAGTCTLTGSGSVLGIAGSGTYTYTANGPLTNGAPVYSSTNTLDIWTTTNGSWVLTSSASLGTSTSSSLTGGTGSLNGQQFMTSSGSAVSFSGTGALTASTTASALVSSGVSVPCSYVILTYSTTNTGNQSDCLMGSSSGSVAPMLSVLSWSGSPPWMTSQPMVLPVSNLNQVWVSGATATAQGDKVSYLYFK